MFVSLAIGATTSPSSYQIRQSVGWTYPTSEMQNEGGKGDDEGNEDALCTLQFVIDLTAVTIRMPYNIQDGGIYRYTRRELILNTRT